MKTGLLLCLLVMAGINNFLPVDLLYLLVIGLLIIITPYDKAQAYNSSFTILLPLMLLTVIGIARGLHNTNRDFFRDVVIFSKTIFYFLGGIAISKYIKNFNIFFKYFFILAFISACIHMGLIAINIHSISSLETIRYVAGFGNEVEGIVLAIILSRMFNSNLQKLIDFSSTNKLLTTVIALSFLLYFSRTLIVMVVVIPLFLCGLINIRQIFSKKNARILNIPVVIFILFYLISITASFQPANSPLQRLVDKFEQIPQEVGWNAQKNASATKEDIQDNWRGYEAYQGLLKFYQGSDLQKILGHGFSETIDLGITIKLAGIDYDHIPIMHNQYVLLLVKSGVVGLLLYLVFLYAVGFRRVRNVVEHSEIYYSYQMLSALTLISLLNTYIGFGLVGTTSATVPFIMGFCRGNVQRQKETENILPSIMYA